MMSDPMYERTNTVAELVEGIHYTAVTSHEDDRATLHSSVCKYIEVPDTLISFTNQRTREFMYLEDDGEWITEALPSGTLAIAHTGSYQPEITQGVCSTTS